VGVYGVNGGLWDIVGVYGVNGSIGCSYWFIIDIKWNSYKDNSLIFN
jgi:hypothetical protein